MTMEREAVDPAAEPDGPAVETPPDDPNAEEPIEELRAGLETPDRDAAPGLERAPEPEPERAPEPEPEPEPEPTPPVV
jgi:hypothetical protein